MIKDSNDFPFNPTFFRAIPEANFVRFEFSGNKLMQVWPNCTVLPLDIYKEMLMKGNSVWYGAKNSSQIEKSTSIVNMCADADEYPIALNWLSEAANKQTPIFNHPTEILNTRRDRISKVLNDVENLIVPQCTRFIGSRPEVFKETFENGNFSYPVLIRLVGTQTGRSLIKVDGDSDWDKIYTIPWPGKELYMTQYTDFKSELGDYAKLRVSIIGKDHLIRHIKFSDKWAVHDDPSTDQQTAREMTLIDEMLNGSEMMQKLIADFKKRISLDFWGIDLGFVGVDQPLIFFEANAAMRMMGSRSMTAPVPENGVNDPKYRKELIHRAVREKLVNHIYFPKEWVGTNLQLVN